MTEEYTAPPGGSHRPAELGLPLPPDWEHRLDDFLARCRRLGLQPEHEGRAVERATLVYLYTGEAPHTNDELAAKEEADQKAEADRREDLKRAARAAARRDADEVRSRSKKPRSIRKARSLSESYFRHFQALCTHWMKHTGQDRDDYRHEIVGEVTKVLEPHLQTRSSSVLLSAHRVDELSLCVDFVRIDLKEAGFDLATTDAEYQRNRQRRLELYGPDGAGGYDPADAEELARMIEESGL